MAKEKSLSANPVISAAKAQKQKQIKKQKSQLQAQRNEKLARRNPERLQRQIDDLKQAEERGALRPRDKQQLEQLERDVKAITKAREALGDKAPKFKQWRDHGDDDRRREGGNANATVLGKRRRDFGGREEPESSDTDADVADIPMPRDTPPPIPRPDGRRHNQSVNDEAEHKGPHALPAKPVVAAQITYSSAPVIRDLRKEATARFVPSAVKKKVQAIKGEGKLLEPEELDKLEQGGYKAAAAAKVADAAADEAIHNTAVAAVAQGGDLDTQDLDKEAARFEGELKHVEMEEVPDEDL